MQIAEARQCSDAGPQPKNSRPIGFGFLVDRGAFGIQDKPQQDAQRSQQIRPTHNVRYRFRDNRVGGKNRRGKESGPELFHQHQNRQIHQDGIGPVDHKIQHMVPGGRIPVVKHRIVDHVRKSGQRPVQSADCFGPPIILLEDLPDVFRLVIPEPGIFENDEFVIECEAGIMQRIRERQQNQRSQDRHHRPVASRFNIGPEPDFRRRFLG